MVETLQLLGDGFLVAFQPLNIALVIAGVALGLFIGAMPGLGSVNGVAHPPVEYVPAVAKACNRAHIGIGQLPRRGTIAR